ncbi:MAG: hypothetical protein JWR60_3687 [Polaromonas sp.]|nr:hypothetical protein [Polaromonas sp.]
MLRRFYITMALAVAAILAIGLLCQTLGAVLLSLLVWGPCFIAILLFYVLPCPSNSS